MYSLPIITYDFFLDKEKYYYLPLLQLNIALSIGLFTNLAVGLLINAYAIYISGMFEIAGWEKKCKERVDD